MRLVVFGKRQLPALSLSIAFPFSERASFDQPILKKQKRRAGREGGIQKESGDEKRESLRAHAHGRATESFIKTFLYILSGKDKGGGGGGGKRGLEGLAFQ